MESIKIKPPVNEKFKNLNTGGDESRCYCYPTLTDGLESVKKNRERGGVTISWHCPFNKQNVLHKTVSLKHNYSSYQQLWSRPGSADCIHWDRQSRWDCSAASLAPPQAARRICRHRTPRQLWCIQFRPPLQIQQLAELLADMSECCPSAVPAWPGLTWRRRRIPRQQLSSHDWPPPWTFSRIIRHCIITSLRL